MELYTKMAARITKLRNFATVERSSLKVAEVKSRAIPFSGVNLAIILNNINSKSIPLDEKNCTLRDGTKVTCAVIDACLKNNGTTKISRVIGKSLVGR